MNGTQQSLTQTRETTSKLWKSANTFKLVRQWAAWNSSLEIIYLDDICLGIPS